MHDLTNAVWIELRKATRSRMPLFTALGFLVLACGLAFLMFIYKYPTFARSIGLISAKANLAGGAATWPYYLGILGQAIAIGGILLFSLVESWVFGREFAEGNLEAASYLLVLFTGLAGLAGTYLWWRFADQSR